jgi:hypothetical protein
MRLVTVLAVLGVQLFVVLSAHAQARCPTRAVGIHVEIIGGEAVFFATAFVESAANDQAPIHEPRLLARVQARVALIDDSRVPRSADGILRGAKEEAFCTTGKGVFVTVSISEKSARAAEKLQESIKKSLSNSPSKDVESYFWQDEN